MGSRPWQWARAWLDRHGGSHRSPSELLLKRLAARRRSEFIAGGTAMLVVTVYFGWLGWHGAFGGRPAGQGADSAVTVAGLSAGFVVLAASGLGAAWYRRRADRRIGASLPQRVAPSSSAWRGSVVGGWFLAAFGVLYGGGLALGIAAAALAPQRDDRVMSAIFAAGVLVYVALGLAVLADAYRRPAVADDAASLLDDELLRIEDAHRAVAPYPGVLALVAGLGSRSGDLLMVAYLGYALVASVVWAIASHLASHAGGGHDSAGNPNTAAATQ